MARDRGAGHRLIEHLCGHDSHAGARCHTRDDRVVRSEFERAARREPRLGDPLDETPSIGAAMRKRDERSSVEVGRAPWWSVTGGCNEHEFFDEHYAR